MTTPTARFAIPKPDSGDAFADGDDVMRAMADRIDYCLGESGDTTITPSAASTKTTKAIAFGRTYKTPPRVMVSPGRAATVSTYGAGAFTIWVDDVTTVGFTAAIHSTNTTTRDFTWTARPKNTDVTP